MLQKSIELFGYWTSLYLTNFFYSIMISGILDVEPHYHWELNPHGCIQTEIKYSEVD